jgi:hypothetical protein
MGINLDPQWGPKRSVRMVQPKSSKTKNHVMGYECVDCVGDYEPRGMIICRIQIRIVLSAHIHVHNLHRVCALFIGSPAFQSLTYSLIWCCRSLLNAIKDEAQFAPSIKQTELQYYSPCNSPRTVAFNVEPPTTRTKYSFRSNHPLYTSILHSNSL